MALRIFNTLTRSLEDFVPLDPAGKRVGLYCCGPTVHDYAHIGNFRTFLFGDLLRRYLQFRGFAPFYVMNITDVEDKIIERVRRSGSTLRDYTEVYEKAFFEDLETLGCLKHDLNPRATAHIPEIIDLIAKLVAAGIGYRAADGSVYFSIEKYHDSGRTYGRLVRLNLEEMRPGRQVRSDEYEKDAVADFALWKARVPEDGNVFWPSPWGEGRPGWHIECSAMSMKTLGPSFDLHIGGEDLMFPHHEDEIAQSEGAGVPDAKRGFVKYWMHGAHLLVEGKKMSKSLQNYFTLRDLLSRGYVGREIRRLLLSAHYREQFNFTLEGLSAERQALARLDECLGKLREIAGDSAGATTEPDPVVIQHFVEALDNDLNVSAAWGIVFDWVRENNRLLSGNAMTPAIAARAVATWNRVDAVFAIGQRATEEIPPEIESLLGQRQTARREKDFKKADALRDELKARGWTIEDTPKGARLKKV